MQNCILGLPPWEKNNGRHETPLPPFSLASATEKARLAEDGWNSRNPEKVALAYSQDSQWRNRSEFINGREAIVRFLARKWQRELEYRLIKELDSRIGARCRASSAIRDVSEVT